MSSVSTYTLPAGVEAHDAQFDFFGKRVAVASSDGVVRLYDTTTAPTTASDTPAPSLCELSGHVGPVWQVRWSFPSFNGGLLASCGYDRKVIVWRESAPNRWEKAYVYEAHELSVNALCFAPHEAAGLLLGCASSDGSVSLIRYAGADGGGQWSAQRFSAHHMGVNALAFAPSSSPSSPTEDESHYQHQHHHLHHHHQQHQHQQHALRFATGGCDNLIKVWRYDLNTGDILCEDALKRHTGWVRSLAWAAFPGFKAGALASGSADGTVCVWRCPDLGKAFQPLALPSVSNSGAEVWDLSWSVEGAETGKRPTLAVTTGEGLTCFWQTHDGASWKQVDV